MLVDNNAERMQGWLDEIAATDGPMAAWRCMSDVIEYHIPKLARIDHTVETKPPQAMSDAELLEEIRRLRNDGR